MRRVTLRGFTVLTAFVVLGFVVVGCGSLTDGNDTDDSARQLFGAGRALISDSEKWRDGKLQDSELKLSASSFNATLREVSMALIERDYPASDVPLVDAISDVTRECGGLASTAGFASAGAGVFADSLPGRIQSCSAALDSLSLVLES